MNNEKETDKIKQPKKAWNKPILYSGKGIEFFGWGRVQTSYTGTGPGNNPGS